MGPIQVDMENKLLEGLAPIRMRLVNESKNHSVPNGSESHFNLILVSDEFKAKSRIQRHRAVFAALGDELKNTIHALTMKLLTSDEWEAAGGEVENPAPKCMGGAKHKHAAGKTALS